MNTKFLGLAALFAATALVSAADTTTTVTASPKQERRIRVNIAHESEQAMEPATFLGVMTAPVSPALTTQLGLPECTGLLVMTIMSDSPASAVLQKHDILLKLDDQILIETRQLAVLVRGKKEGDEVTLTFMRLGKQQTAKVKLGKKNMPKLAFEPTSLPRMMEMPFPLMPGAEDGDGANFVFKTPGPDREAADLVLNTLREGPGAQVRIFEHKKGMNPHATMLEPEHSNMIFNSDDGSLELTINDGKKSVVAKDKAGKEIFSGPANTPEELKAMPESVREKFNKIESMDEFSFKTDSDFLPSEHSAGRGAANPIAAPVKRIRHQLVLPSQVL